MKKMKTDEVLELIKKGRTVEDVVLSDIEEKRLSFRDALLLVENGFLVSKENLLYKDSDIAYDAEFEEVKWEGNYRSLKDVLSSKDIEQSVSAEVITIELSIKDQEVRDWLNKNTGKLKDIVHKLVVDLYHTDQILHSK